MWISLAVILLKLLNTWLYEQKIKGCLDAAQARIVEDAARKWELADPDRVRDDDPDLFS